MALIETFTDTFDGTAMDPALWVEQTEQVVQDGGVLRMPLQAPYFAYRVSHYAWQLQGSQMTVALAQAPAAGGSSHARCTVAVEAEVGTYAGFTLLPVTGELLAEIVTDYDDSEWVSVPYDPVGHRWLRVRESGGTLHLETSPDALSWTVQRAEATPPWIAGRTDLAVVFEAARTGGGADFAHFDDLGAATVQPPAPEGLLRANTCDGPPGSAVTIAASAAGGSHFDVIDTGHGIVYDADSHLGAAAVRFPAGMGSGKGMAWQGLELGDFAVRGYLRRDDAAESGHIWWMPVVGGCILTAGGGLSWAGGALFLPGAVPAGQWVRVEAGRDGATGWLRVWSTDPASDGAPDAQTTAAVATGAVSQWWWERYGPGGIWWDELALTDSADPIGPAAAAEAGKAAVPAWGLPMIAR